MAGNLKNTIWQTLIIYKLVFTIIQSLGPSFNARQGFVTVPPAKLMAWAKPTNMDYIETGCLFR